SPTPNWYTQDLEIEKNRLKALRRRAQRAPQDQRNARFQFHKEELKKYMRKVKTAKNSGWKSFCTIASNPYGTHYKAAFRKAIKPAELIALNNHDPSGNHLKIAQDILEKIFPHPANSNSSTYIPPCTANDCPFTKGEVATVIHHLSKGKAPGPNGIDIIIIQQIFKKFPFLLMELFNTCLKLAKFPDPLKVGSIILFHKHGKSKTEASSYRPISLLPTIGKVLEKLLTQRLNFHLEKNNRLSNLEYGFRAGRSTEMAITKLLDTIHKGKASGDHVLVLSIDIKGAFDNIQHSAISSYLDNSKCPANIVNIFKNFLQNRKVILNTCEGPATKNKAALKGLAVDQPSGIWPQMKYFKKTGHLTPAFKPSQTTLSWFPMPRLESNLSHKLTNLLLNSPPGQAKTNSKYQQKKQIISLSAS
ncbi:Putative protein in type-1 retrotransposable element R1DM, partial [Araneus ventricosus]